MDGNFTGKSGPLSNAFSPVFSGGHAAAANQFRFVVRLRSLIGIAPAGFLRGTESPGVNETFSTTSRQARRSSGVIIIQCSAFLRNCSRSAGVILADSSKDRRP